MLDLSIKSQATLILGHLKVTHTHFNTCTRNLSSPGVWVGSGNEGNEAKDPGPGGEATYSVVRQEWSDLVGPL